MFPAGVFRTIVVGADGRDGGRDALHLAHRFAEAGGGELVAVRVFAHQHRPALAGSPAVEEQRLQTLAALDRELSEEGIGARIESIGDMSPARALHRVAAREHADLLVVGSTHRGPLGRVLVGDVAIASLHGSPCPVAVAPRAWADRNAAPLSRIGVGFDGGQESRRALAMAAALAKRVRAGLELLLAVSAPGPLIAGAAIEDGGIVDYRVDAEELISRTLGELDVEAVGSAAVGPPVEELVELTRRVDLLVVGSRGWGPVRRILLGSTAASLTREARCPLLVVPRGRTTGQADEPEPGVSLTSEDSAGSTASEAAWERSLDGDVRPDRLTAHESVRDQARVGRFSEGLEDLGPTAQKLRRGRFSDGLERPPRISRASRRGGFAGGTRADVLGARAKRDA